MCGIMGYTGHRPCKRMLYDGLAKLEYRGYDSSGIAVVHDNAISLIRSKGKLTEIEGLLPQLPDQATVGIGHTRWATHGLPSTRNAHPHVHEGVAIVHNGILENYQELKVDLLKEGVVFESETDSEIILHLVKKEIDRIGDAREAIINIISKLRGAYSLGVVAVQDPGAIYLVKQGSPMVIGRGDGENFYASDALALFEHTNRIIFLEDGEMARITPDDISLWTVKGETIHRDAKILEFASNAAEKNGYRHFMLKEIHEQPRIVRDTIQPLLNFDSGAHLEETLGIGDIDLDRVARITIAGCGTAFHAGMLGKYMFETYLRLPVEIELASELRYRNPVLNENTLIIAMTQSGETADTLACVKMARERGAQVLTICNVRYSSIPRASTATLYMNTGPEIGVASTKAFTSMILNLYLLALCYAWKKDKLDRSAWDRAQQNARLLPALIDQCLNQESAIEEIAKQFVDEKSCLFIGRGMNYPLALEGSLKLKEISYIHAEGYAGGELKHGPIALVDKTMPLVAIVSDTEPHHDKMLTNIEEVCAREGQVLGIGNREDVYLKRLCRYFIPCPQSNDEALQTILSVIPLQLFSYYVAVHRGTDVDQPRNLAKSVTVE